MAEPIQTEAATVVVEMACDPTDQRVLVELALAAETIFAQQPGFLSSTIFRSRDGTRLLQQLTWRSVADSQACMKSPDWEAEAGQQLMAFIGEGRATLLPRTYDIVSEHP